MTYKQTTMTSKPWAHGGLTGFISSAIVSKLKTFVKIEIPVGYQDESGFHYGVKTSDKNAKSSLV